MDAQNAGLASRALQFGVTLAGISLLVWLCFVLQTLNGPGTAAGMPEAVQDVMTTGR